MVPKNRSAIIKLRDALIEEVRYLDADRSSTESNGKRLDHFTPDKR